MTDTFKSRLSFASDNYSGICPEALNYLIKANNGYDYPYGVDSWTDEACNLFRDFFETDCEVFFVYNGTAANALAISSLCQSYNSVICAELAHIETDECGATEFFSNGAKILLSENIDGKLSPEGLKKIVEKRTDIHYPKPKAASITQSTEVGTVYKPEEIAALHNILCKYHMKFHMDGARLANAIVSLGIKPKEITWQKGIDVLCFGGVKNGIMCGEAVIFFKPELADEFAYRCKQSGQLASKMRFIAAQWIGLLKDNIWFKNAKNANNCAEMLVNELNKIEEIKVLFPVEANEIFVDLPDKSINYLKQKKWHFYNFIGAGGCRFVTSWNTKEDDVDLLVNDIKQSLVE